MCRAIQNFQALDSSPWLAIAELVLLGVSWVVSLMAAIFLSYAIYRLLARRSAAWFIWVQSLPSNLQRLPLYFLSALMGVVAFLMPLGFWGGFTYGLQVGIPTLINQYWDSQCV